MGYRRLQTDSMTGIPVPMWYDTTFNHFDNRPEQQQRRDDHHTFYPRAILEDGDLADKAFRACRVQTGPRWDHEKLHQIFAAPALPRWQLQQFGLVVLCAAGYIPDTALSFNEVGVPRYIDLTPERRSLLWSPKRVHVESPTLVQKYMLAFVVEHGLDREAARQHIDEFLHMDELTDRLAMGQLLIEEACKEVTSQEQLAPLKAVYSEARAHRRLPVSRPQEVDECLYKLVTEEQGSESLQPVVWLGEILAAA